MPNIKIRKIRKIIEPHNLLVERATNKHIAMFEDDLCDADKYDLSKTWRQDWKAELHMSFVNSASTFVVSSKDKKGAAVFGLTPRDEQSAQVWLLQSKSFSEHMNGVDGRAWVYHFVAISRDVIAHFLSHYPILFNFISLNQKNNIRWLKYSGFDFFDCKSISSEMLMFAQGENAEDLANDKNIWRSYIGKVKSNE